MEWIDTLFVEHTAWQAVVVIALICAVGMVLGKVRIGGISLGVAFVFFVGILAGHAGLSVDRAMLEYAESFGLVLFVYSLGLQVGPGFFSSFHRGGVRLNLLGLGVIAIGTCMTVLFSRITPVPLPEMMGVLCGATTNTPALGAAQQTLNQLGIPSNGAALSCAVTYPLGVLGVILAILVMRRFWVQPRDLAATDPGDTHNTYIAAFQVQNPGIFDMSVREIARISHIPFVISRLWRDGRVSIPTSDTQLQEGDRLLIVTTEQNAETLTALFGGQEQTDWNKEDVDWNAIDSRLISQSIVITRPEINGKRLGSLRLRNSYGINISRVYRSGVPLLATPSLVLQIGDRVIVVGEAPAVHNVEKVLGNAEKNLNEPNIAAIFIGIILGLAVGAGPAGTGRRADHRGHSDRHVRPAPAYDHLHHAERQPDVARHRTVDVSGLSGAGRRRALLRHGHAARGGDVDRTGIRAHAAAGTRHGMDRAALVTARLRFDLRHVVRRDGQPDGAELRQRHHRRG